MGLFFKSKITISNPLTELHSEIKKFKKLGKNKDYISMYNLIPKLLTKLDEVEKICVNNNDFKNLNKIKELRQLVLLNQSTFETMQKIKKGETVFVDDKLQKLNN